jgi:transglutaminase-like putative cysteine protease
VRRIESANNRQVKRAEGLCGNAIMNFEITHKTTYTYSRPVFLDLHHLRIRPRSDGVQHVTYFDSKIDPRPSGSAVGLDIDGNCVENVWFHGLTEKLTVESRAKVITQYRNPFNYILAERADRLPVTYQDPIQPYLAPYTVRRNESHLIERFARDIANRTEWKTLRFVTMLTREISEGFQQAPRGVGVPKSAEETYLSRVGSSRDLAVLFMDACRYVGIAARFVNGYYDDSGAKDQITLHSWSEVYLPGAGWRGYDPSLGLAVTDRHVAIAAAGDPLMSAPVSGTFRGNAVSSELHAEIDIRVANADAA